MKILFLDVDGVLNIQGTTYNSHGYDAIGNDPIEPHLMRRLETVLERVPDLKIVISSAWFESQLKLKLSKQRFKYLDRIIGSTSRLEKYRGLQIKDWLNKHTKLEIEKYLVIDDEVLDICGSRCDVIPLENVIEIDMREGLSDKNAVDIIIKLNNLAQYDYTKRLATLEEIEEFITKGYRPHVNISNISIDNNPYESFRVDNKNLSLHLK